MLSRYRAHPTVVLDAGTPAVLATAPDDPPGVAVQRTVTGAAGVVEVSSGPNLLVSGQSYAVTIKRFHFAEGDDTGQWRIVGDGLWAAEGGGELSLDADESELPDTMTIDQLKAAVDES